MSPSPSLPSDVVLQMALVIINNIFIINNYGKIKEVGSDGGDFSSVFPEPKETENLGYWVVTEHTITADLNSELHLL